MASSTTVSMLLLVERVVIDDDDPAWEGFLFVFLPLAKPVIYREASSSDAPQIFDEAPGWLKVNKRKLDALYARTLQEQTAGNLCTEETDKFVANYFRRIISSYAADWYRQHRRLPQQQPRKESPTPEDIKEVRKALLEMNCDKRSPFWLRHYRALGPLAADDLNVIADLHGMSAATVADLIEAESEKSIGTNRELSSRFIGELLNLPPASSGKYVAVDQRIYRTRIELKAILQPESES